MELSLTRFLTIDATHEGRDGGPRQDRGDGVTDPA